MLILLVQAVILGLVQGLAEFIPISSSAHLIIIPWLFGWSNPALTSLPFDVSLHLGTLAAVLVYFWKDWLRMLKAVFLSIKERRIGSDPDRRMAWFVVIGTLPGAVAGMLLESKIESLFHQPGVPIQPSAMVVMAVIIALLGLLLLIADRLARHEEDLERITLKQVLAIGFAQALAIFPGVSRSGGTITAGLALGLKREAAAKFSFLLSAPIIAGAGLKSLAEIVSGLRDGSIASGDLVLFPVGIITASLAGFLCIHFMLNFMKKHPIDIFAFYRWGLALVVAVAAFFR